jgi:hypothetical protein
MRIRVCGQHCNVLYIEECAKSQSCYDTCTDIKTYAYSLILVLYILSRRLSIMRQYTPMHCSSYLFTASTAFGALLIGRSMIYGFKFLYTASWIIHTRSFLLAMCEPPKKAPWSRRDIALNPRRGSSRRPTVTKRPWVFSMLEHPQHQHTVRT